MEVSRSSNVLAYWDSRDLNTQFPNPLPYNQLWEQRTDREGVPYSSPRLAARRDKSKPLHFAPSPSSTLQWTQLLPFPRPIPPPPQGTRVSSLQVKGRGCPCLWQMLSELAVREVRSERAWLILSQASNQSLIWVLTQCPGSLKGGNSMVLSAPHLLIQVTPLPSGHKRGLCSFLAGMNPSQQFTPKEWPGGWFRSESARTKKKTSRRPPCPSYSISLPVPPRASP